GARRREGPLLRALRLAGRARGARALRGRHLRPPLPPPGARDLMTTPDATTDRILALACERFSRPAGTLSADDDLFQSLGIDSMQALDLLTRLEETFDVEIPDYELQGVATFRDLADLVRRRL